MDNQTFDSETVAAFPPQNVSETKTGALAGKNSARPFWLSRWTYLSISAAVALIVFFIVWGILNDDSLDAPWIPAGAIASVVMLVAVSGREILVRRARMKYLLAKEKAHYRYQSFPAGAKHHIFTLENNTAKINEIRRLSEAANGIKATAETHLAVVQACQEYLAKVESAVPTIHAGSPRLAALRSGQEKMQAVHHKHLLAWAAEESRTLAREASLRATTNEKVETAQKALAVLDSALQIYPTEPQLIDSTVFIREFIATTRISYWIELAERAEFKKQYRRAIDHYRDALFYISKEDENLPESDAVVKKIESEIEKLRGRLRQTKKSDKKLAE